MTENKSNLLLVAGFIVIVLLLVWQTKDYPQSQDSGISASGSAKLDVAPDESQIFLRLETTAVTPKDAQDKNSARATDAINSLLAIGLQKSDVETTNYRVEIIREWNPKLEKMQDNGYRAIHSLKATTRNLDLVGKILETAVFAGVNNIDNVIFTLSKEKQKSAKAQVIGLAAKNAQEKADVLASSLNVALGKIKSVSESSFDVVPYYARTDMVMESAAKALPPIQPSDVEIQAQVNVVFNLK